MKSKYIKKICYIHNRTLRRLYSTYIFVLNVEKRDGSNLFIKFITTNGENGHFEFSRSKIYKTLSVSNNSIDVKYAFLKNIFMKRKHI